MESVNGNGSSDDLRTGPASKLGEGEQLNSGNKTGPSSSSSTSELSSQDHFQLQTNATTKTYPDTSSHSHDQSYSQPESDQTFFVTEQGDGSTTNSHLGTHTAYCDEGMTNISDARTHTANILGETHFSSSNQQSDPSPVLSSSVFESSQNQSPSFSQASESSSRDSNHISVDTASNSHENTNVPPKPGLDSQIASESSDDIPISSMPKHRQSSDVSGQNSPAVAPSQNREFGTSNGPEIQNPPLQVMERPGDSASPSEYRIPSHVFASTNTNAPEWSTASNESLFSIYMGNMSFTSEFNWYKSGELDKYDANLSNPPNAYPSTPPPANKFNDISQQTADLHKSSGVTEAKAAETMREVIRENTENISEEDLSFSGGASRTSRPSSAHHQPHPSDGSTKPFAFQVITEGDKSVSSRVNEEKPEQQKPPEPLIPEETPNTAPTPKSTTNPSASQSSWLSCFSCCTFGH